MSYILDALRRAEAERERGSVPGLHTQPVAPPAAPAAPARTTPVLVWGAAALVLVLAAALAWLLLTRPATPGPTSAPAPATDARSVQPPAPPPPAPLAIAPAEAVKVVPVVPVVPTAPPSRPAAAASPAAAAPPIVPWERLPEAQRRQLPALAISGAIWSESAANRMLIVSGQLLHEGDNAAPGVVLEQIRPKSAVLRRGELRYEVSF